MDGNNQNNMGNYIPQEIPIPGVSAAESASMQPDDNNLNEGQANSQYEQSNDLYGQQTQRNPHEQQQNSPYRQQSQYNPYEQQNNPYGQQPQYNPYHPKEKKSAAKIVIAIACVCVVLIVAIVGGLIYFRSTPVYKISKGFQNIGREITQTRNPLAEKIGGDDMLRMMQEDGCHVDTSLDFSMDMPMMGTVTLGLDTDFYKDMKAKELNAETSLSMINYEFGHLNIYANDEVFCFSVPELFMEDMYIENENVVSQFNNSILAEYSEQSDAEEFSIDLFSIENKANSIRDWKSFSTAFEQTARDIDACREAMTIEKVEKGLYRVTFPKQEINRLVKNYMKEYSEIYEMTDSMSALSYYDNWVTSDLSLLFEISSKNRIESIMIEEPVKMLDSEASVSGELFFLGEDRSIDKVQGKISVDGVDGETREIICQIVQDTTEDEHQVTVDAKYSDDYDELEMTFSMKDDIDDLEFTLKGGWDDIVKGESANFELQKLAFTMDDEELFRISGDIMIEPITDKIEPSVEAKTAFFEMSLSDWEEIIYNLDDEYGSLLDALW